MSIVQDSAGGPRLVFPSLASFYAAVEPVSYALMRFTLGAILIPHGYGKLFGTDLPHVAQNFVKLHWPAPMALSFLVGLIEFFGGIALALGLFTRVVAAIIAVEMAIICFVVLWPNWEWVHRGMEYPFLMGVFAFAMALRGGGPLSLDHAIGREI